MSFRILKLGCQRFELALELRLCLGLVLNCRLLQICKPFLQFRLSFNRDVKLLLKLTDLTLSLGLPLAHLPFDLSLILYPLTFFASHHDLQGLNLTAESFDLISLRAEYCLLLALSLLLLLF